MQINDTPDIISIYDNFIKERNAVNSENRYKGNEHWYHASSAGMCRRKIYYASVEQAEQTNPPEPKAYRLMRLGTIVHNDIQKGLKEFAKEKESSKEKEILYNSISSTINSTISNIYIEEEVRIEEFNVRGFFDVVVVMTDSRVFLMDIKTIGSYPYKLKFGRKAKENKASIHQELQLATYGLAIKRQMGRLDGMFLVYYNKDNSQTRVSEVSLSYVESAKSFWETTHNNLKGKTEPPFIESGISPVMDWECRYCAWKNKCELDG